MLIYISLLRDMPHWQLGTAAERREEQSNRHTSPGPAPSRGAGERKMCASRSAARVALQMGAVVRKLWASVVMVMSLHFFVTGFRIPSTPRGLRAVLL